MDPLSIAATSATLKASCHEVINPFAQFPTTIRLILCQMIASTSALLHDKVPDQDLTISSLGQDLRDVSHILDKINLTWRSHSSALMMHPSANFGMWPAVQDNLDCVRIILDVLHRELQPILNSGRNNTIFKVYAKAWRLGLHIGTISIYRGRLVAHEKALKVSANMMVM